MIARILILFTLLSCTKYNEVKKGNGLHYIENMYSKIDQVKEVNWKVGRKKNVDISKGLRLYVSMPNISPDGRELLEMKYGINSLIYRLNRVRRGASEPLGYFFFRLGNMTRTSKNFTLSLYYHAASVSKSFRMFHCPAFNHKFKLENFEINSSRMGDPQDMYVRGVGNIAAKATRLRFAPMITSGGLSLKGKYTLDFALYNEKTKNRYSKWQRVDGVLDITKEVTKALPSCLGVKEELRPLPESRLRSIRDLEIK